MKAIRLIFIFLFLINILRVSAQSMNGRITDGESGVPLENVNLQVLDSPYGASSQPDGNYLLKLPDRGDYLVMVSMVGYKTAKIPVTTFTDSLVKYDIQLFPTILQLTPIEVTARKYRDVVDAPQLESPSLYTAISVVKKDEIQKQGAKTLTEAMQYIPGGLTESRGRKVKQFFSIRGQTYPYPEYAVNGAWQREFHELPYFYPSSEIERIEVVRSSAALLTGLTGLVGIIKVDTRLYESPETSYSAEYGTFRSYRVRVSHGSKIGQFSYATGVGLQGTEGPEDKNAEERIGSLYGRAVWHPSEQFDIDLNILYLNGKRALSLAESPASKNLQTLKSRYDPYKATLVNLKAFYKPGSETSSELQLYYSARDPVYISESMPEPVSISESDYEFGVNFTQALTLFTDNTLRLGGLYNHWVAPKGKRFYAGRRCDLETLSFVAVDEHHFGNLNLDAGIRWARTYIDEFGAFNIEGVAGGFARVEPVTDQWEPGVFSTSLGAAYYFDVPYSLHLNLSAGQIKPRAGAITQTFEQPENENRIKFDLGVQTIARDIGQLTLTGFLVKQNNAIVLSDTVHVEDGVIMEYYMNRDQDQAGIEFEARSALWFNSLQCFFNMLYMYSRFEENGEMKINQKLPDFITSAGIYFDYAGFDVNLFAKYVSGYENKRFAAGINGQPPQPQPLGDYLLINTVLGKTFGHIFRTRFYLEIQNLTDVRYSTVVGYPDFGRKFIVGISQVFH